MVIKRSLGEICDDVNGLIRTGPFGSQLHDSDYTTDGIPVVMPKDIIGGRVLEDSIARVSEETAQRLTAHRLQAGDIVYGRRGDIGRRALIKQEQAGWPFWPLNTTLFVKDFKGNDPYWLLYLLRSMNFSRQNAAGAVPGVNRNALHMLPVKIPPRELQARFGVITGSLLRNVKLGQVRDLLLPRLISGEIDVSSLSTNS